MLLKVLLYDVMKKHAYVPKNQYKTNTERVRLEKRILKALMKKYSDDIMQLTDEISDELEQDNDFLNR